MPRPINEVVQAALESTARSELMLVFLTITDPAVVDPIRIVCEEHKGISSANGLPINYKLGGNLYAAIPFGFSRLSDDERPARARLSVPAFSNVIGEWLRNMTDPARMRLAIYPLSNWVDEVDVDNARVPVGTPELIYDADHMFLRTASGDSSTINCEIGGYDFTQEPLGPRATKALCPDIYR